MKTCPYCGASLEDNAVRCSQCQRVVPANPDYQYTPQPVAPQANAYANQPPQYTAQNDSSTETAGMEIAYAGFWVRWAASIIDSLIAFVIAVIPAIVLYVALGSEMEGLIRLVLMLIIWSYFILLTYKQGATWGKNAFGLQVISDKGGPLSIWQVVLRETVGKFASQFTLMIGYLMVAFTSKKQGLHDMIGSTVVVYRDPNKRRSSGAIIAVAFFFLLIVGGILAATVLISLNSARTRARGEAFKSEVRSAATNLKLVCNERKIEASDIKESKFYDSDKTFNSLVQDCGKNGGTFTAYFVWKNGSGLANTSAVCESGECVFSTSD